MACENRAGPIKCFLCQLAQDEPLSVEGIAETLRKEEVFLSGSGVLFFQPPAIHAVSPTVGPTAPVARSSPPDPTLDGFWQSSSDEIPPCEQLPLAARGQLFQQV